MAAGTLAGVLLAGCGGGGSGSLGGLAGGGGAKTITGIEGVQLEVTPLGIIGPSLTATGAAAQQERDVAVRVQLRNTGTAVLDDMPYAGAELTGHSGKAVDGEMPPEPGLDPEIRTADPAALMPSEVTLAPGEALIGSIDFHVPAGTTVTGFVYQPEGAGRELEWDIGGLHPISASPPSAPPAEPPASSLGSTVQVQGQDFADEPSDPDPTAAAEPYVPETLAVTVDSVADPAQPGPVDDPVPGYHLVAVHLSIHNTGANSFWPVLGTCVLLFDDHDRAVSPGLADTTSGPTFGSDAIQPGATADGYQTFWVADGSTPTTVRFMLSQGTAGAAGRWQVH